MPCTPLEAYNLKHRWQCHGVDTNGHVLLYMPWTPQERQTDNILFPSKMLALTHNKAAEGEEEGGRVREGDKGRGGMVEVLGLDGKSREGREG